MVPYSPIANNGADSENLAKDSPGKVESNVTWWPWIVSFTAVYTLALPWIFAEVWMNYLVNNDWQRTLPGLDTTSVLKVAMGGHFLAGSLIMLSYPFQFIPSMRQRYAYMHRWNGRLSFSLTLACVVAGMTFIGAKGKLVGGWNMSVAFSLAGMLMGVCAFVSWRFACLKDFERHANWAIRAFSQVVSPFLYRYWYNAAAFLGYRMPAPYQNGNGGEVCADDFCPAYVRPFDALHCWTYWLLSLAIAEAIICARRNRFCVTERDAVFLRSEALSERNTTILIDENAGVIEGDTIRRFSIKDGTFLQKSVFIAGVLMAAVAISVTIGSLLFVS